MRTGWELLVGRAVLCCRIAKPLGARRSMPGLVGQAGLDFCGGWRWMWMGAAGCGLRAGLSSDPGDSGAELLLGRPSRLE
jgi:hypothetical protein